MKRIGIIGFGNMGSAIAERIKSKYQVCIFEKDKSKTEGLQNILIAQNLNQLINDCQVIILAVKPQDFDLVLKEMQPVSVNKLIISIAAGITTKYIEKILQNSRIVRVMPNIAAKIGEAESALAKGSSAKKEDELFVKDVFDCVGKTWVMPEDLIDAATAISGSGPAYIFYDMERNGITLDSITEEKKKEYVQRLTQAAQRVGFDQVTAIELATATIVSSVNLCAATHILPAQLRMMVTSKGGTTEAAIKVLISGGTWTDAALAAKIRAKELSKE